MNRRNFLAALSAAPVAVAVPALADVDFVRGSGAGMEADNGAMTPSSMFYSRTDILKMVADAMDRDIAVLVNASRYRGGWVCITEFCADELAIEAHYVPRDKSLWMLNRDTGESARLYIHNWLHGITVSDIAKKANGHLL